MKNTFAALVLMTTAGMLQAQPLPPGTLTVDEVQLVDEHGLPAVVGVAKNAGNVPIGQAFVKVNLLDSQGNLLGNTIAAAGNIAPGQLWRFKAMGAVQGVASFKIVEINVYK